MCQLSCVRFHIRVSGVTCHMSPFSCHMSLTQTATATAVLKRKVNDQEKTVSEMTLKLNNSEEIKHSTVNKELTRGKFQLSILR